MRHEVFMPIFGQTQQEATITRWVKQIGEWVEAGDTLLEIETEKTTYEVEASASGYLRQILFQPGSTVPVLTPIAYLTLAADEPLSDERPEAQGPGGSEIAPPPRPRAAPSVRRLARELGVDLAAVKGSGSFSRIHPEEVRATAALAVREVAAAVPEPVPVIQPRTETDAGAGDRVLSFSPMRRVIARRLSESFHSTVPVPLTTEAVIARLAELRSVLAPSVERQHGVKLTWNALVLRAVAIALRQHPHMNASYESEVIRLHGDLHLGVAVALKEGLLVPVIRQADRKSLGELARSAAELVQAARAGKLPPGGTDGGTFTVSNLGAFEVDVFGPVLNPPQVAILGVGRVVEKPVVLEGQIVAAPVMTLSLVFDHRAVDGAPAAAFLQTVKHLLENAYDLVV